MKKVILFVLFVSLSIILFESNTYASDIRGPVILKSFAVGESIELAINKAKENGFTVKIDKNENEKIKNEKIERDKRETAFSKGVQNIMGIDLISTNGMQYITICKNDKDILNLYYYDEKEVLVVEITDKGLREIYNAKGSRKGFIEAFMKNYNIPNAKKTKELIFGIYAYVYTNDKEGWKIDFMVSPMDGTEVSKISIGKIEKVEDFKF